MERSSKISTLIIPTVAAYLLWSGMFLPAFSQTGDFWWKMTGSALVLAGMATVFSKWYVRFRFNFREIILGLLMAAALWAVFWVGDKLSSALFHFARPQVNLIYGMKEGASFFRLSFLLLLLIGPAEEIFWRGFLQRGLSERYSENTAMIVTILLYTGAHLCSMNFMLIMAAMAAGAFWGAAYRYFPEHFPAIVLSHALWDAAVFVWFPI